MNDGDEANERHNKHLFQGVMAQTERQPMPNGRMRIPRLLTEGQKVALRALDIDGLILLNHRSVDFAPPETWIEYWFDKNIVSEDELRSKITGAVYELV